MRDLNVVESWFRVDKSLVYCIGYICVKFLVLIGEFEDIFGVGGDIIEEDDSCIC